MSHTDVRIEKPKEFEINKKLRTIDERLNELENMSQLDFMKLHNMAELQQDHDSTIKELYAEWQKRKQEQEMKNLQQTDIEQHGKIEINDATNTKIEKEDAESRREKALKRLEARLRAISSDTENPYTVAL